MDAQCNTHAHSKRASPARPRPPRSPGPTRVAENGGLLAICEDPLPLRRCLCAHFACSVRGRGPVSSPRRVKNMRTLLESGLESPVPPRCAERPRERPRETGRSWVG